MTQKKQYEAKLGHLVRHLAWKWVMFIFYVE